MICSATRGYGFHGLSAWYIAVAIVILQNSDLLLRIPKMKVQALALIMVFFLSAYIDSAGYHLLHEQEPVSELESAVIAITEEGEEILMDVCCIDSNPLYFMYKGRYPANRAIYMLPWYMDWYEQDVIGDLQSHSPRIVIYNEEEETWEYKYYANNFVSELKENYARFSNNQEDGWQYLVWIKKGV